MQYTIIVSVTLITLFLCLVPIKSASLDNGIEGEPEVECMADAIVLSVNTKAPFEGHVYVKGFYDNQGCRKDATLKTAASLRVPFDTCDVRRKRSSNPRGLSISAVVVVTFHPMFITMVDRAYNVECFYMEAEKVVTQELGVSLADSQYERVVVMLGGSDGDRKQLSGNLRNATPGDNMLTTQMITHQVPMPICTYEVLENSADGTPVRFANVGQLVYHQWKCTNDDPTADGVFCMTVHSCTVENGQGKRVQLLDENGCSNDKYLLTNLDYTGDLAAGQGSMVFKFADRPSLFFQCQIRLTLKEGGKCERTSDTCSEPLRGKRSVDKDIGQDTSLMSSEDTSEVDVFSHTITVFDIDAAIASDLDATSIAELNRQKLAEASRRGLRAGTVVHKLTPTSHLNFHKSHTGATPSASVCLSPGAFSILTAMLAILLLVCLLAIAVICVRKGVQKSFLRPAKLNEGY